MKDATEAAARVELHSTCQTISVDRSHIANVGVPTKDGGFSSYSRTPAYGGGSQTPMYSGGKTPMHGNQTPMYESKYLFRSFFFTNASTSNYLQIITFSNAAGSRTPHYGSMTPSHDAGSRTPGQSGAWDPTVTNTPARNNDFGDYNLEDGGSPSYAAGGYPPGPFTPQTPGGTMYGSEQSFGPYQASPSPVASATASPSPAAYGSTPSPAGTGYTTSPHGAFASPSPMGYSPMTPGLFFFSFQWFLYFGNLL